MENKNRGRPELLGADATLLQPIVATRSSFFHLALVLLGFTSFAFFAWLHQLRWGLGTTGLNVPVYWGSYITNFVFFIGISHAGTLISAILRLCHAEWRRSITRAAEVITVLVLFFGVGSIIVDLGRPDRMLNVLKHPNFRSPLLWDVCSVSTYLLASSIYLYLPLIPDIALLRDYAGKYTGFYRLLALGWQGTPRQWRVLNRAISVMAVLVIPIAISVHTVVSWVFGMTVQPMWHSTIFGPYFVVGAIFSGIASLIIAMALIRRIYFLQDYLKEIHFRHLGTLLLVFALLWFYFTFAEHLTTYYGHDPAHLAVFYSKLAGRYAPLFWGMVLTCLVIPVGILARRRTRPIRSAVVASVSVLVGMWLERFTIVIPTLAAPRVPWARVSYSPTWVELGITLGFSATFIFLYMVFTKFFPIVSIWEVQEGREAALTEVAERVKSYLPGPDVAGGAEVADGSVPELSRREGVG
ncbi:MAG: polysulfide reductase NrfD [Acidobacteria bacterium]|nr:polysulfide reductase NrfD [Acidobacteriota bacterium]MBI3662668.1 polysulfide reductase NrfD [Acidobacteriota bacterium]